jgi:hypothetical protein
MFKLGTGPVLPEYLPPDSEAKDLGCCYVHALGKFQNHPLLFNILKHCVVRGFGSSR